MSQNKSPVPYDQQVGFLKSLVNQARLVGRLMVDGRVPFWLKLFPAGVLAYLVWPLDLISGGLAPIVGPLVAADDLAAAFIGLKLFIDLAPPEIVAEHMAAITGVPAPDWQVDDAPAGDNAPPPRQADDPVVEGEFVDE